MFEASVLFVVDDRTDGASPCSFPGIPPTKNRDAGLVTIPGVEEDPEAKVCACLGCHQLPGLVATKRIHWMIHPPIGQPRHPYNSGASGAQKFLRHPPQLLCKTMAYGSEEAHRGRFPSKKKEAAMPSFLSAMMK